MFLQEEIKTQREAADVCMCAERQLVKSRKRADVCRLRRQISEETISTGNLTLDFQPPELWENKLLSFEPPILWLSAMAALAN